MTLKRHDLVWEHRSCCDDNYNALTLLILNSSHTFCSIASHNVSNFTGVLKSLTKQLAQARQYAIQ